MMNSSASRERCSAHCARGHQVIEREIAVGHRIEAVGGRHGKTERLGGGVAVDRKARPRQRRRAQRALARPPVRIDEARAVACRHFVIGHEVVTQRHRLRGLQVGEARHDAAGMLLRPRDQSDLQRAERGIGLDTSLAHPQLEIGRHLVVAAARGVEPPAAGPISSARRLSVVMWMSSRSQFSGTPDASYSAATWSSPAAIAPASSAETMPCAPSIATWALLAAMSCRHNALSKGIEAFISRMIADGPSLNRPPHI